MNSELYVDCNLSSHINGIIMYQIADGEPPFRNWLSDDNLLAMRICNGLRPEMPDSAPDEYKKLAERCCDADPNNRPANGEELYDIIRKLIDEINDDSVWNTIYCNKNTRPLSRIEKESKYSSRLLPTGNLPKPRNSWEETIEVVIVQFGKDDCAGDVSNSINESYIQE